MRMTDIVVYESSEEMERAFKRLGLVSDLEVGKTYPLGTIVFSLWLRIISANLNVDNLVEKEWERQYKKEANKIPPEIAMKSYKNKYEKEILFFHILIEIY